MEVTKESNIDSILLEHFEQEIWSKVPHLEDKQGEAKVINTTPLIDLDEISPDEMHPKLKSPNKIPIDKVLRFLEEEFDEKILDSIKL